MLSFEFLVFSETRVIILNGVNKGEEHNPGHFIRRYKNITREYLANTYGEVVSPEHAEFIIELCKVNGIPIIDRPNINKPNHFIISQAGLGFYNCTRVSSTHLKQITIPLPPKQIQSAPPEEEFEMTNIMKNAGDNLILGCEDSRCDEWPKINSEVKTGVGAGIIRLMPDKLGHFIVEIDGVFCSMNIGQLSKPKTPEEVLKDEVTELVWKANDLWTNTKEVQQVSVQEFVATKIIDKYNITKKPQ